MKSFGDLDMLEGQVFGEDADLEQQDLEEAPQWGTVEEWETPKELESSHTVMLTLTVDDNTQVECRVIGVFLEGEKEYIALELPQEEVQIMELEPGGDDEIRLANIQEEEEQERVIERFMELFAESGEETAGTEQDVSE